MDPLAVFKGPTSKGKDGEGEEKGEREGEGKGGEGENDLTHPLSQISGYATGVHPTCVSTYGGHFEHINQSINLYLSQAKAHTNTHAHTHTQKTTTMYNKRNKKETVENDIAYDGGRA